MGVLVFRRDLDKLEKGASRHPLKFIKGRGTFGRPAK